MNQEKGPAVFLDFHSNKQKIGRVVFDLFGQSCPKAAENFRQFCTGEFLQQGRPTGYKDTCVHRIVQDRYFEGGDFLQSEPTSQTKPKVSIFGGLFEDENLGRVHKEPGLLSLVNGGVRNGNGNLFLVTGGSCPQLDGKNVIFGRVRDEQSLKVVKTVCESEVGSSYRPKYPVVVRECGEM